MADIVDLIYADHDWFRRQFFYLDYATTDADLAAVWEVLALRLETHAEAEEVVFYPALLKKGKAGDPEDETEDAIEDHNEIRDTAAAVDKEAVGSDAWLEAVGKCNRANGDHMAEEERQGLTDFRRHAALEERHALGVRFAAFEAQHLQGVEPVDKDPKQWVKAHRPQ